MNDSKALQPQNTNVTPSHGSKRTVDGNLKHDTNTTTMSLTSFLSFVQPRYSLPVVVASQASQSWSFKEWKLNSTHEKQIFFWFILNRFEKCLLILLWMSMANWLLFKLKTKMEKLSMPMAKNTLICEIFVFFKKKQTKK